MSVTPMAAAGQSEIPKGRVRLLDMLRGFSVLGMVAYHTLFDIVWIFGHEIGWYMGWPGYVWQQSICWVFILVSGASLHYSRRPLKRALVVLGCGLVVSVVSIAAMPEQRVMWGILHMIGLAMLVSVPLRPLLEKINKWVGLALSFVLFVLTKTLPMGYIGVLDKPLWPLPEILYQTPFLFPLGFPSPGFFSGDYFPLIPWLFLFYTGWFGWSLLKGHVPLSTARPNLLEKVGRRSLIIYMVHQPIVYGILLLLHQIGVV